MSWTRGTPTHVARAVTTVLVVAGLATLSDGLRTHIESEALSAVDERLAETGGDGVTLRLHVEMAASASNAMFHPAPAQPAVAPDQEEDRVWLCHPISQPKATPSLRPALEI